MSVYWSVGGIYWGESILKLGSILKTTSSCCRRQLPYFCGHVPQESGTRADGSLSENWSTQKT